MQSSSTFSLEVHPDTPVLWAEASYHSRRRPFGMAGLFERLEMDLESCRRS